MIGERERLVFTFRDDVLRWDPLLLISQVFKQRESENEDMFRLFYLWERLRSL